MDLSNQPRAHKPAVLDHAPGPSPWYLLAGHEGIPSRFGELTWHSAGTEPPAAGKVLLRAETGAPRAILGFYCYVRRLDAPRFLLWYVEPKLWVDKLVAKSALRLCILDADRLEPIADVSTAMRDMAVSDTCAYWRGGLVAEASIGTDLTEGTHHVALPTELGGVEELLLLVHSTAAGCFSNYVNRMHLTLWIVRPNAQSIEVIPQDWFNQGDYDFGHQWPTRMARDPDSGRIIGEGIRLGVFELDESARQVSQWILSDPFYHPER